ncbi:hypothetical protein [Streptomyces sp. NPDC088915]|uniref:hypothetical protein n=1 Tax=Streptomyces sp. NPDC088915 TaxID=3365912 RepID=UPI00382C4759
MDYAYAVKALPPNGSEEPDPEADQPLVPPQDQRSDDSRPWAGDPYDEGDETDPAEAVFGFTGQGEEEAWLDKAQDGTLTGWVRDDTGQVWRYSDPDAWAIDVDDAAMTQTHGPDGAAGAAAPPAADGTGEQPSPQSDGADPFSLEVAAADEVPPPADSTFPEPEEDEETEEDEDLEDEEKPASGAKKTKKPWD